jgi:hypothetical protein
VPVLRPENRVIVNTVVLTVRRQYDSSIDYPGQIAAADQWGGNTGAHPGDIDNFNNTYRVDNAVKFAARVITASRSRAYMVGAVSPVTFHVIRIGRSAPVTTARG